MTSTVHIWWNILWSVATINITAWIISASLLFRRQDRLTPNAKGYRQLLLWLSAGYVAGCAFRSFLPRIDLERICLMNSWLSSMVVGRSVATIAELCFMSQCAILLHHVSSAASNRFSETVSFLLVPLIVIAEIASWYAILSTNYLGHVIENSIWTFSAMLLLMSFIFLWPHGDSRERRFLAAMIVITIGYIIFMVTVDVPMYWSRWNIQLMEGIQYLSIYQGLIDASRQCTVSFDWRIWREEIPWMTLYFTVAVWVSIFLPHAPEWRGRLRHRIT